MVDLLVRERYLHKQSNGRLEFSARASGRDKPGATPARRQAPKAAASSAAADCEAALVRDHRPQPARQGIFREQATARRLASVARPCGTRSAGWPARASSMCRACGWRMHTFDAADLEAYLEAREALELKALELARPRLVGEDLQRMLRGNSPVAGRRERLDNRLHAYLVEKARNRYLADFFERHGLYYTTLLDHAAPAAQVVAEMARQHRAILRALLAQDWPRARRTAAAPHPGPATDHRNAAGPAEIHRRLSPRARSGQRRGIH